MVLKIVHYNDSVLRTKGAPVTTFDSALATLARDMVDTMHDAAGIGLAAQQIGIASQFCVVDLSAAQRDFQWELDGAAPPLELIMPMVIANPKIEELEGDDTIYEEGCLSFPGINGDVVRPDAVRVEYQDEHGTPHVLLCDGLLSRCIQHEADHLNGTLFIDRMSKKVRASIDKDIKELAKQTRDSATPQSGS
ncbi:peptide deformylase [Synoicihabitans lomoniglobus]|uniref:Peptide deformylase n=1 Tax=Synoicihabitans lomoniglobus TaxID=2909285 RepID=A0AAE9ZVI0_9BACT|nr:peptide deformylase [Opitutaceae bacterium LMO-M01]WED63595.1 peptide deformylase [Opitutaceae bacterium LMO-M01]